MENQSVNLGKQKGHSQISAVMCSCYEVNLMSLSYFNKLCKHYNFWDLGISL